ncbi:hypothetical protein NPIL_271851 [Nephila pilipes]|uniref:Uncharacterized protein n=1 Tax=Nephila pilipes TaxID=299642 RepID=A0A8X6TV53_NEPPI|nr:hypothetical protein NPIL_271851 [Nephila pilipes]
MGSPKEGVEEGGPNEVEDSTRYRTPMSLKMRCLAMHFFPPQKGSKWIRDSLLVQIVAVTETPKTSLRKPIPRQTAIKLMSREQTMANKQWKRTGKKEAAVKGIKIPQWKKNFA